MLIIGFSMEKSSSSLRAPTAGVYVIMASTDRSQGKRGISAFIVERETPGLNVCKMENKLGYAPQIRPPCRMEPARVPKDNRSALSMRPSTTIAILQGGRVGIGAMAVASPDGAFEEALKYAEEEAVRQIHRRIRSDPVDSSRHGQPRSMPRVYWSNARRA